MVLPRRLAHLAFVLGMVFKGIDGLLEVAGAIALLLISKSRIDQVVDWLAQQEFGPTHALAHVTTQLAGDMRRFTILYLFVHGGVKLALVAGLLRGVRWVFPVALVILTGFIAYQLYRLSMRLSLGLGALTVIDVIVVLLIFQEWRYTGSRDGRGQ